MSAAVSCRGWGCCVTPYCDCAVLLCGHGLASSSSSMQHHHTAADLATRQSSLSASDGPRPLPQAPLEELLRVCLSKQELAHVFSGPHTLIKVEQLAGGEGPAGYGMQVGAWAVS